MPASLRMSAMVAVVLLSAALTAATELLSLVHAISFWPVLIFWLAALGAAMPLAAKAWPQTDVRLQRINPRSRLEWILCSLVLLILAAAFLISRFYPPQTVDTLTYHLPRQVMWWQQASLDNFDSAKFRNLSMPPFSEYIGLHLFALTGGSDLWHTSVQWAFLVIGLCGVSLLVRYLGGARNAQWLGALFAVTFPVMYYEASAAKNDIIPGVFLVAVLVFMLQRRRTPATLFDSALIGLALGLACLTKGTAYVFGAPIFIWMLWRLISRLRTKALAHVAVILLLAALINAGYWARNQALFGRPLGPAHGAEPGVVMFNQMHAPAQMLAVLTRHIASLSLTQFEPVNHRMHQAVEAVHHALGVSIDDRQTTFIPPFELETYLFWLEECMTSILHNLLTLAALVAALIMFRRRGRNAALGLCILAGFLFFTSYLSWQQFHVRLLLPMVFFAGALLAAAMPRRGKLRLPLYLTVMLLLMLGFAPALYMGPRQLLAKDTWLQTREELRMSNAKKVFVRSATNIAELMTRMPGVKTLGLEESGVDNSSYIVMRPIIDRFGTSVRFCFTNPRVRAFKTAPLADAIIGDSDALSVQDQVNHRRYAAMWLLPPYSFYLPAHIPPLNDVPMIVQGAVTEVIPTDRPGVAAALIQVESVLRGPPGLKEVYVMSFTTEYLMKSKDFPIRCKVGNRGIWLLKPSGIANLGMLPNGQYLLDDSQLPDIQKLLKP